MAILAAAPKDLLLSLINENNSLPVPVTEDNLYFGAPALQEDGLTSVVPTVGDLAVDYTGYKSFSYHRTNLSTQFGDTIPALTSVGASSLYLMLDVINRFLGTSFTTDDLLDSDLSSITSGAQKNILLKAQAKSLGYIGQSFVRFSRQFPNFSSAVLNTALPVLTHPLDPTLGKNSLRLMFWSQDFTFDLPTLKLASNGKNFASIMSVQAMMGTIYGLTGWPVAVSNSISDLPTSQVPDANPAFDRVTIQPNVVGGTYQGDMYFHYNT